jgi:hypothetical protein
MLAAALRYAKVGWPVFPVQPLSKQPYGGTNGLLDATTDIGDITEWWTERPDDNVAIATGAPGPDVLDVDVKAGADGVASLAKIAAQGWTRGSFAIAVTPSGGWHLYYAGTDQRNSSLGPLGLDFRATGGYVLAPPSVLDNGVYTWRRRHWPPGRTVEWKRIKEFFHPPRPARPASEAREPGDFAGLLAFMADYPEPGRNVKLYSIARQMLDEDATERDLADLLDAAIASGLPFHEADRTIQSARRGGGR